MVPALYSFASGLALAALTAGVGYFNWGWVAQSYPGEGEVFDWVHHKPVEERPRVLTFGIGATLWIGVISAFLSLASFGAGVYFIAQAFAVLGVP